MNSNTLFPAGKTEFEWFKNRTDELHFNVWRSPSRRGVVMIGGGHYTKEEADRSIYPNLEHPLYRIRLKFKD